MSEFESCGYCTQCQTINDDMGDYCHRHKKVVHEVCVHFEHWEGKKKPAEEQQ